jgi:hypothetical protein
MWMGVLGVLQTSFALSLLGLSVPRMLHSCKLGFLTVRCSRNKKSQPDFCNFKKRMRTVPSPTPRYVSASKNDITETDHTADDLNELNKALPIALKGWRVIHKISSGRAGNLYQVSRLKRHQI